jgi:hypothetical protein
MSRTDACFNTHRPHRALKQAALLRRLPGNVIDLDRIRVQRRDRVGGVIHEYRLVAGEGCRGQGPAHRRRRTP